MIISKSSINLTLTAILTLSFASFMCESKAQGESGGTQAMGNSDGAKEIRVPTAAPRIAPCISWLPTDTKPRLAMLCIHGLSLHKGCFAAFGKEMARYGIATYAMDLRGFGELKDTTTHTELDFDGCLADIKAVLEQIHKNHPGLPVVILGESMGGAIALRATALYPKLVSGLVSSVPARDRFSMSGGEIKVTVNSVVNTMIGK